MLVEPGSPAQKLVGIDSRLLQNRSERPLGHVAGMVWNCRVPVGARVVPNLVTAGCLAIKSEPKGFKLACDVAIEEP